MDSFSGETGPHGEMKAPLAGAALLATAAALARLHRLHADNHGLGASVLLDSHLPAFLVAD